MSHCVAYHYTAITHGVVYTCNRLETSMHKYKHPLGIATALVELSATGNGQTHAAS